MPQKDLNAARRRNLNIINLLEKPSSDSCERCGQPLLVMKAELFGEVLSFRPACECRIRELEEQERQARINELLMLIRKMGLESGLYARMTLEGWELRDTSCEAAANKLISYLQGARLGVRNWLYLYGSYGLGKTHLAVAALRKLCMEHQWEPLLVRWSEYCSRIQQSWHSSDADSEYDLWRRAANVTLLVLDDIDKRASSEWALGKLYELIDYRYVRQLPTILTANRSLEALSTYWAKNEQMLDLARAIVSRTIGQLSAVIEFSGHDYRLRGS